MNNVINGGIKGVSNNLIDTRGMNVSLDILDFAGEFLGEYGAYMIPLWQRPGAADVSLKLVLYDSLIKYIGKKGVRWVISTFLPIELQDKIDSFGGIKYVGDGIINVMVGVLAKKALDLSGLGMISFSTWFQEFIDEVKTEIVKQGIKIGASMVMTYKP